MTNSINFALLLYFILFRIVILITLLCERWLHIVIFVNLLSLLLLLLSLLLLSLLLQYYYYHYYYYHY